jgi:putative endonuclease
MLEHRNNIYSNSFSSRYNINKLVYFESYSLLADAFEKKVKLKVVQEKRKFN